MKHFVCWVALCVLIAGVSACSSNKKSEEKVYRKKIYLTQEDYLEDLDKKPHMERRQAKPNTESDYIFNVQPETEKNVYFFDERTRPMVPGVPSERDYKNTKRLHQKPRRYTPEQYYGNQGGSTAPAATDSSADYDDEDSDY